MVLYIVNLCRAGRCQNGGTCSTDNTTMTYRCSCPDAFTGTDCETGTCNIGVFTIIIIVITVIIISFTLDRYFSGELKT